MAPDGSGRSVLRPRFGSPSLFGSILDRSGSAFVPVPDRGDENAPLSRRATGAGHLWSTRTTGASEAPELVVGPRRALDLTSQGHEARRAGPRELLTGHATDRHAPGSADPGCNLKRWKPTWEVVCRRLARQLRHRGCRLLRTRGLGSGDRRRRRRSGLRSPPTSSPATGSKGGATGRPKIAGDGGGAFVCLAAGARASALYPRSYPEAPR